MKKLLAVVSILIIALSFSACSREYQYSSPSYCGTFAELTLTGEYRTLGAAEIRERMDYLGNLFNLNYEAGEINKINALAVNESLTVSAEMMELLALSQQLYRDSEGAFNPALYGAIQLWGFSAKGGEKLVPTAEALAEALQTADFSALVLNEENCTVSKTKPVTIDLGGVAKGYIVGKLAQIASKYNLGGIINIGGNIYSLQESKIAVSSPREGTAYNGTITITNSSICTSGDYERFFIRDGVRYHHILDKNGYPANGGFISVTVVAADAAIGDALSTAVFVGGAQTAQRMAQQYNAGIIALTETQVFVYGNLTQNDYSITNKAYSFAE